MQFKVLRVRPRVGGNELGSLEGFKDSTVVFGWCTNDGAVQEMRGVVRPRIEVGVDGAPNKGKGSKHSRGK